MIIEQYLTELEKKYKSDMIYQERIKLESERDIIKSELTYIQNKSAIYPSTDFSKRIAHLKDELAQAEHGLVAFLNTEVEDFDKIKNLEKDIDENELKKFNVGVAFETVPADETKKDEPEKVDPEKVQKLIDETKEKAPELTEVLEKSNANDVKTYTFIVEANIKAANKANVKNIEEELESLSYKVLKSEYNKKLKAMIIELSYVEGTDIGELPDYCTVLESYEWTK